MQRIRLFMPVVTLVLYWVLKLVVPNVEQLFEFVRFL